ncbi:EthD domain-containing protein [Amycolatopsis acidicola]|nr:EthD domain-containing protein [Amycolatopsis acidicola]
MYAVIGLLRKKPGVTTEEFRTWWHEKHVPYVLRNPGVVHYVTYPIDEVRADFDEDKFSDDVHIDGVAVIYYESKEVYRNALESKALKADKAHLQTGVDAEVLYSLPHVHKGTVTP